MENIEEKLKERVKRLREKAEMSQEKLASLAKISTQTIKDIESGRTSGGIKSLRAISLVLGISYEDLMGDKEPEPQVIREKLKISRVASMLKNIPDDIYEMAEELGPDHQVWEIVRGAYDQRVKSKAKAAAKGKPA